MIMDFHVSSSELPIQVLAHFVYWTVFFLMCKNSFCNLDTNPWSIMFYNDLSVFNLSFYHCYDDLKNWRAY